MGSDKWKVRWNAPEFPTVVSPLEIVIEQAPPDHPTDVTIEVWESDAREYEVDDYGDDTSKQDKKAKPSPADEHLVTFTGTLAPHPTRPHGVVFKRGDTKAHYNLDQGNDHVGLRFEAEANAASTKVAIPPSGFEPVQGRDGEFYELFFVVRDADAAPGAEPMTISNVHLVRRRTDRLLAVEPLHQGNVTMGNTAMSQMIMDHFHPGDAKTTKDRNWGGIIVALRDGAPMFVQESGCSILAMTMIIRYLRIRASEGETAKDTIWETIYDRTAGGALDPKHKPLKAYNGATHESEFFSKSEGKKSEPDRFTQVPRATDIDKMAAHIAETDDRLSVKKVKNKSTPKAIGPDSWEAVPTPNGFKAPDGYFEDASFPAHWWVARFVWWMREQAGAKPNLSGLQRGALRWTLHLEDGTQEVVPALDEADQPFYRYRFHPEGDPDFTAPSDPWKPIPPTSKLLDMLDLSCRQLSTATAHDWETQLVSHLDRGLPAVAHFKTGCYSLESGGHYTVVVGYRKVGGVNGFIINDPASAKSMQYECLREAQLKPADGSRDEVTDVTLNIHEPGAKDTLAKITWTKGQLASHASLSASLLLSDGTSTMIQVRFMDTVAGNDAGTQITALRFEALENALAPTLFSTDVSRKVKGKESTGTLSPDGRATCTLATGQTIEVSAAGEFTKSVNGPLLPQAWEGQTNVLVERRKQLSCLRLYLFSTKADWGNGAARFLEFDGRSQDDG